MMINRAIQFASDILNQFIKNRFGLDENRVLLNKLIDGNGSLPQINQNKIVISLINIEKETAKPFYNRNNCLANGSYADISTDERYNLDILISSNFDDYNETLKFLNAVILFFQAHNFLDARSFQSMPAGLTRLEFVIEKINYQQMQGLWTAMGAKYQPSVIYKMRLITIQANEVEGFAAAVSNISNLSML